MYLYGRTYRINTPSPKYVVWVTGVTPSLVLKLVQRSRSLLLTSGRTFRVSTGKDASAGTEAGSAEEVAFADVGKWKGASADTVSGSSGINGAQRFR